VKPSVVRSDLDILADIRERFRKNPYITGQDIHITVNQGVVTLSGSVYTEMVLQQAEQVALFTPGVVAVNDLLTIRVQGQ